MNASTKKNSLINIKAKSKILWYNHTNVNNRAAKHSVEGANEIEDAGANKIIPCSFIENYMSYN